MRKILKCNFIIKLLCERFNQKELILLSAILFTLIITTLIIFSTRTYAVSIDNKYIGIVDSRSAVQDILKEITKVSEARYGTKILISSQISYKSIFLTRQKRIADDELRSKIERSVALTLKAFAITVGGKDSTYLKDRSSAEGVLNKIKAPYIKSEEDSDNVAFLENVGIIEREVSVNELKGSEEAFNILTLQSNSKKEYTVQENDIVGGIAEKLGLTVEEIRKVNPGIDIDNISIGQKLSIVAPRYIINVKKSSYKTAEEKISYGVEYEDTQELFKGDSKVKVIGVEGSKLVKTEIVSINGILEETNVISEDVLEAPKTEIVLRGTKERPRTVATGVFEKPSRGSVSSRFGERWSRQHTGIDIAVPEGTPNKASDGGVVTFAGWDGNYGKLIIIDHENGLKTYYAHNDTIKVKNGQRVAKGDVIGTAGTTGRVTGPHLHFEVRKNGIPVNPSKFVAY